MRTVYTLDKDLMYKMLMLDYSVVVENKDANVQSINEW